MDFGGPDFAICGPWVERLHDEGQCRQPGQPACGYGCTGEWVWLVVGRVGEWVAGGLAGAMTVGAAMVGWADGWWDDRVADVGRQAGLPFNHKGCCQLRVWWVRPRHGARAAS